MRSEGGADNRLPAKQSTSVSRRKFLTLLLIPTLTAACREASNLFSTTHTNTATAVPTPRSTETARPLPSARPTETPRPTSTARIIPTLTPRPTETPKPTSTPKASDAPISIEIYDDKYINPEILVQNLIRPGAIMLDPGDNSVYFVQKEDNTGARSEAIFQLISKTPVRRFQGAGDPWGQIQRTYAGINSQRTLFVYKRTYLGDSLTTHDLPTGRLLSDTTSPFANILNDQNYNAKFSMVRGHSVNPANDRFYMSTFEGPPLVSVGASGNDLKPESPKNLTNNKDHLAYDKPGNAFISDSSREELIRIPAGGDGTRFQLRKLLEAISDMSAHPGKFSLTDLAYDSYHDRLLIACLSIPDNSVQLGGTTRLPKLILSADIKTGVVSPLAKLTSGYSLELGGLAVSPKTGDLFITTYTGALPIYNDNGRIIRVSKN